LVADDSFSACSSARLAAQPTSPETGHRNPSTRPYCLDGARPADLPIERPVRFALTVNQRTANTLGIKIPQALLLRADEVIQ